MKPVELTDPNFENEVLKSSTPVLVDFWGPQCRPCLALMPAVDEIEKNNAGKLKVGKLNATQNRMLCARLKVLSLPTYLFYKGGVETNRMTGESINKEGLTKAVDAFLA